ncbi:MAG: phosphatidate cytidylyltransferase [Clostridia bacterium]|nr:phosphatidate cytidylyltransferase [Clostridia bacterium]
MAGFWQGACAVCVYFVVLATGLLTCRRFLKIPDELFRKMLHFVLLGSYVPFVFAFDVWWHASLLAVALAAVIYPALRFFERFRGFSELTTERRHGELKHSLLLAFSVLAASIAVCRGLLGDRYMVLACVWAWGVGDAFAALIGKRFGRHKIRIPFADQHKSWEGSCAMFITSAATVLIILLLRGGLTPAGYAVIPLAGAAAATLVEMITPGGYDTITCPAAAMLVILPLTALMGGF